MLALLTRESVDGFTSSNGIVLNTDYMSKLQVYESTKCRFKFLERPEDRRGGFQRYVVSETMAAIKTEMDKSYVAISIQLNIYPDNDHTKAVVATIFPVKEIIQAYPQDRDVITRCWIEVNEKGFKPRKYLVAHRYTNLPRLASTGTTTTTSTTSSSTTSSTTTA